MEESSMSSIMLMATMVVQSWRSNMMEKAKKYSYTKDCKEQPREICDQCEKKTIQPV